MRAIAGARRLLRVLVDLWRRRFVVVVALVAWLGALHPIAAPMWVGGGALVLALPSRRRTLIAIGVLFGVAVLSHNARSGLRPLEAGPWSGRVVLTGDPTEMPGRVVVDVETDQGRMQMSISGADASSVRTSNAGVCFEVRGRARPLTRPDRVASRHLRMALVVTQLTRGDCEEFWRFPVDAIRSAIEVSAEPLPQTQRPIYLGFIMGDDRGTPQEVIRTFEDSGLSHLLVVSGENVVFVIAVASALLGRTSPRVRSAGIVVVLLLFMAVTRFEPSVLRASTMALLAVMGSSSGRPLDTGQRLAAAVAILLVIDPLLVESFGFRLSVVASIGIALWARSLQARLRGPQWVRQVLAVTIAAQLAVAPLVIPAFGPMPSASIPANVLAGPVAGVVMMWGTSVGLVAGALGSPFTVALQWPVCVCLWWIMRVAEVCAELPLPRVGTASILLILVSVFGGNRALRALRSWRTGHRPRCPAD